MMTIDELENESQKTLTRRNFFKVVSSIVTGFIIVTLGIPMVESMVGSASNKKSKTYSKLTSLNSIHEGTPENLPLVITKEDAFIKETQPENVWAVKTTGEDIRVFSPICPHLGCRYQWHAQKNLFICPCHNSVFNKEGKVVSGPAPRPLDTLPIKKQNNYLYVLWERFKPGIAKKEVI